MPLSEKALKSSLDSGALYPVYVIFGNDGFLKKQAVSRIIKATVNEDDDLNLLRFEAGCELQDVYDELNGFPVMADKKCVILTDFDVDSCGKNEFERLVSLAGDRYETSVFVVFFDTVNVDLKRSERAKKLIAAAEGAGGVAVLLDHRTRDELARQLSASAKKQGCVLSAANAGYLIDTCSAETQILVNELSKLCAFAKGAEITRETIDAVAVKSVEASVYNLSARIISGDTSGAMSLLDDLYFMKVAPEIIIFNISSAFVDMFRAAAAKEQGLRPENVAADFKMKGREFVLRRAGENLRRYDYKKLDLSFSALLDADRKIKSYSSDERIVMEQLIVKLIYIMKTGDTLD